MAIIVQKYGGTSVCDAETIINVAKRIKSYYDKGNNLVVVVSAMGKSTDAMIELAYSVNPKPDKREMDMLLSTGEQVTISILALALNNIGIPAISYTGLQLNIKTNSDFSNARIHSIDITKIEEAFKIRKVVIVAGFQGVDKDFNITTLGRGGSDTSGVALAAVLKAEKCEIFTDVNGIYTADPRIVPNARKLKTISYDEMLELARLGTGVLHSRSVEFGKKYGVVIHVRSSFNNEEGTLVLAEDKVMEETLIAGVTIKKDDAKVFIINIEDRPGIAADLFGLFAEKSINVDMIAQSAAEKGFNTISFTIPKNDVEIAEEILKKFADKYNGHFDIGQDICIVSAVGIGMKSNVGVAAKMFKVLADNQINIHMISTSEIKISIVILDSKGENAVRLLHDAFDLNK